MTLTPGQVVVFLAMLSCALGGFGVVLYSLIQVRQRLDYFSLEARRIDRTDLALEVARLEGKKYGVNIAQIREVLHSVLVLLAREDPGSVYALLERVRVEQQKGNSTW